MFSIFLDIDITELIYSRILHFSFDEKYACVSVSESKIKDLYTRID